MDLEELLAILDIDSPSELVYFEQFTDLMEQPQEIPYETLAALIEGMDPETLAEMIEGYFDEIMKFVPDCEGELYTLLQNISTTLVSLAGATEDDSSHTFAEELYKFRSWYMFESTVLTKELAEGTEREIPLMEALTTYHVQNFTDDDFLFDFSDALDYHLDEYIVSLSSLAADSYDDGDEYDGSYEEDEDYHDPDD